MLLVKKWIDTNYKLIRSMSKLQFLRYKINVFDIKINDCFPLHLECLNNNIQVSYYKSESKLSKTLYVFKRKLLDIEIFYLRRNNDFLQKKTSGNFI